MRMHDVPRARKSYVSYNKLSYNKSGVRYPSKPVWGLSTGRSSHPNSHVPLKGWLISAVYKVAFDQISQQHCNNVPGTVVLTWSPTVHPWAPAFSAHARPVLLCQQALRVRLIASFESSYWPRQA